MVDLDLKMKVFESCLDVEEVGSCPMRYVRKPGGRCVLTGALSDQTAFGVSDLTRDEPQQSNQ